MFGLACKTGWTEDTDFNKCLKAFTGEAKKMTWQNAQRKCEEQGLNGNLASLVSEIIVKRKLSPFARALFQIGSRGQNFVL